VTDQTDGAWRRTFRTRTIITASIFAVWAVVIEARLIHLQIAQRADLQARADRQQNRTVVAPAKRGEILDRHGRILAFSVDGDSIYAVPTEIDDPVKAAATLCSVLDECSADERNVLAERLARQKAFAYVRRHASPAEVRRVAALGLDGVGFMKENRRFYPNRELAAQVLGYVGVDNTGLGGLEAAYDREVRGQPGTVLIQVDARRQAFSRLGRPPTAGATLELTIDQCLQYIAERALKAAVEENRAEGGAALIMDPRTGEILALANEPTFNPNAVRLSDDGRRRNRVVQDLYEPGSTFKVVTASAAIEEDVMKPTDVLDVSAGRISLGSRVVEDVHAYGPLSFVDVIVKSSNVGAIKIGLRLGPERLGRYVRRFGFGTRLSPDFPGENGGIVWDPAAWSDSALASVAMGYQIGVTPLQMAAAVSSVANGGELVQPRVVRAIIDGGVRTEVPRHVIRRTVSPTTAAELVSIMEAVVDRGTGQAAKLSGYTVAGKTGTAAKLTNGRYSTTDYNASFVGFVPSRKPALTIIVVIDSPHAGGYYGGTVAAPVFKKIAEAALQYLGVPSTVNPAPPVLVNRAAQRKDDPEALAPTPVVAVVSPVAGAPEDETTVPDLIGLSAREAMRTLARAGMTARLSGDGFVVDQQPPAGSALDPGAVCRLSLGRLPTTDSVPGPRP
jgi:cell division protein FtsI (penicillin-binding protein 3)